MRKKWLCEFKYAVGDFIYYHHWNKDTYPGIVIKVKSQLVKIKYNSLSGDVTVYVKEQNLSRQKSTKKIEIVDNLKYTEKQLMDLTEALRTSKQSFIEKIGDFEDAETGKVETVYADKNGLLTI